MKDYIVYGNGYDGLEIHFNCSFPEIPTCIEKAKKTEGIVKIMVWRAGESEYAQTYIFDGKEWFLANY